MVHIASAFHSLSSPLVAACRRWDFVLSSFASHVIAMLWRGIVWKGLGDSGLGFRV